MKAVKSDKDYKQKNIKKLIKQFNNNSDKPVTQRISDWNEIVKRAKDLNDLESLAIAFEKLAFINTNINNFEKALGFCKQAISYYKAVNNSKKVLALKINIGVYYLQIREFYKAIKHYNNLLKTSEIKKNKVNLFHGYKYMGLAHYYLGNNSEALESYKMALKTLDKNEDTPDIAVLYNMIGMLFRTLGKYDKALEYLILSSKIKEKLNDQLSYANNLNNIGAIYIDLNNEKKALRYYNQALDIYVKTGNKLEIAEVLTNIATLNRSQKKYDQALELFNKSLRISKKIKDDFTAASTLNNLGGLYIEMNNKEKGISYKEEALRYKKKVGNKEDVFIGLLSIAYDYLNLGKIEEALENAEECLTIAKNTKNEKFEYKTFSILSDIYAKRKEYKIAYEYHQKYAKQKDNIFNEESSQKIAEMQTKYETEKKEKEAELERTRAENLKLKNIELKAKNELIEKQKHELQESIDKLHQSEIKYDFVAKELSGNICTNLIGESESIKNIIELISTVARSDKTNVLITGESGTGKEIIARNIHEFSMRKKKNFYAVNSSAIPKTLFESQFFGHDKNAFTGASSTKIGWFEIADKSTLFLDEIGTMSIDQQVKLLRVLEERKIVRVGSHSEIDVDVRIISATNINLLDFVKTNKFRSDLYHRLATFVINIPPLKDRKEDIPLLLRHFIKMFAQTLNKKISRIDGKVDAALSDYDFPGNVRELKNMVERAVLITKSSVLKLDSFIIPKSDIDKDCFENIMSLEEMEKILITKALKATNFNRVQAAKILKVERKVVERRMKKYGINT